MASTIVVPGEQQLQLPSECARKLVAVATAAKTDIEALQAGVTTRNEQYGSTTLVAGTKTINTGITITATSRVFVSRTAQGGTSTGVIAYECVSKTAGAPGTGSITIQANNAAGTIVNTDTSTVDYLIVG